VAQQLKEATELSQRAEHAEVSAPRGAPTPPSEARLTEPSWDQPGGLDIKEQRSWRTWHLLATALGALLIGMAIGHANAKPAAGGGAKQGLFKLPDSSATTAVPPTSTDPTTSSIVAATTDTTPAAETPVTGVVKVLFDKKAAGPLAATAVSIKGGTWKIGWAYDCTKSGSADGTGTFQVVVAPTSGAGANAVNEVGRNKTGVTSQTVAGALTLEVRTACRWAVKVTGIPA